MDPQASSSLQSRTSVLSLVASCAVLAVVIAPMAVLVAWLVTGRLSSGTLTCAAVGGSVCLLAATMALATTFLANRMQAPVQGVLVGMLFRMGLPLVAIIAFPKLGEPLGAAGVSSTIVGVYLFALVVETALSLRMIPSPSRAVRVV